MIFDTDIIIWLQRGNDAAAALIEEQDERQLSIYSYMELMQGAKHSRQHRVIQDFFHEYDFEILPLTQEIGHRAAIYIDEYALSHGLRAGDALIAATAVENGKKLASSNKKHFQMLKQLQFFCFNP